MNIFYIFEIKFEKKIFCLKMAVKQVLLHRGIIPIYANKRENGAADMKFFHQKMRNWYLGNYNKREKNLYPFKQEARKTK